MVCRGAACDECTKNCRTFHQKRKDQSPIVTRFFKIMFGKDYSTVMYLPPEFARMVKHLAGQETQIEDSSGLRWSVTLSYVKGSLAFQKGWRKFFQDHDLEEGQLLVFIYIKGSHFNVQIFGRSACEKINFNNGMPRQNKRFKREQATSSEEQPFQKADVNSGDKPISATSVSSRSKFENCHTNLAGANRMQFVPTSLNMEDPTCTIFRDDGYYQGEDRNFLLDLSSFEMENRNNQKGINSKLETSHCDITENAAKVEKSLDKKTSHSHTCLPEHIKTMGDDVQMVMVHSGDIFTYVVNLAGSR